MWCAVCVCKHSCVISACVLTAHTTYYISIGDSGYSEYCDVKCKKVRVCVLSVCVLSVCVLSVCLVCDAWTLLRMISNVICYDIECDLL